MKTCIGFHKLHSQENSQQEVSDLAVQYVIFASEKKNDNFSAQLKA